MAQIVILTTNKDFVIFYNKTKLVIYRFSSIWQSGCKSILMYFTPLIKSFC